MSTCPESAIAIFGGGGRGGRAGRFGAARATPGMAWPRGRRGSAHTNRGGSGETTTETNYFGRGGGSLSLSLSLSVVVEECVLGVCVSHVCRVAVDLCERPGWLLA